MSDEMGISIELTTDKARFCSLTIPKINYSVERLTPTELFVEPAQLLFEKKIRIQDITCFQYNARPAFFKSEESDFPFDIFSATFYLLSRYEEYLPHSKNSYGAYAHENSLAFNQKFLHIPLINYWIEDFKEIILKKWPSLNLKQNTFRFIPTYDIDTAWKYQHKGLTRNLGSLFRHSFMLNFQAVKQQVAVLKGRQQDPWDAYSWLEELHQRHRLHPIYFFLMTKKRSKHDRNLSPNKPAFQRLIRELQANSEIGIHPSWLTMYNSKTLLSEINLLQEISSNTVTNSRQHFIRWQLPSTYRSLIQYGIQNEFSMGYSTINGFRASVASPYKWFDLPSETTTTLRLWPFCFMDSTAIFEQHSTEEQAFREIKAFAQEIKKVNGIMITIWHNNYLGTDPLFRGWKNVYKKFVESLEDDSAI